MLEKLNSLKKEFLEILANIGTNKNLENLEKDFLGKK
jgi:hypothetical protein